MACINKTGKLKKKEKDFNVSQKFLQIPVGYDTELWNICICAYPVLLEVGLYIALFII